MSGAARREDVTGDIALGRACNWSVALFVCGVVMGLIVPFSGALWLVAWLVVMALSLWIAKRQFRAMERLIDGQFGRHFADGET